MRFSKLLELVKGFLSVYYKQSLIGLACVATVAIVTGTVIAINSNNTKVVAEENVESTQSIEDSETDETTTQEILEETTEATAETEIVNEDTTVTDENIRDMIESGTIEVIPIEELEVAENDTSNKDEVMGGGNIDLVDNSEEIVAQTQAQTTQAQTSEATQSQETTSSQQETTTQAPTTTETATTQASTEYSTVVKGIDVSKWQGSIDWNQVKDSGITFVMIKCGGRYTGNGGLYEDSYFRENIQGALNAGLKVGIYFFSQATTVTEAYEEASLCVDLIKDYNITYPVAFDWESASGYRVTSANLSTTALTEICETFADTVKSYGYTPMIYFNRTDWRNAVNTSVLTSKYKVWLATYYSAYYYTSTDWQYGNDRPYYSDIPYCMWQYGVTNVVNGISGYVDMDLALFDYN
ncbi:glycoside hydrolase family 25 protein [Lachnospira multipara]|uniref:glycoside hydrolase family 25 protein n=1 Tax=Lachnospira multipara TaxID=28051 RepID=UPI000687A23B|nr:glycoside hydrolase family 25 protein [Lachnospira multipara]